MTYLDTHVVVWLYAYGRNGISANGARYVESDGDLRISPMVRLELQYLWEIDRVTQPPVRVLDALGAALGLYVCDAPFPAIVREAENPSWTRDPFDRLIVAHAALFDAPLLTRDATIHAHYQRAIW